MSDTEYLPTQFKVEVPSVEINLDASDLALRMPSADLANLLIEIDAEVGQWEFTLIMYRYFKGQFDLAKVQVPHLVETSEAELWRELRELDGEADATVDQGTDTGASQ